jgi:ribosome-binding protein aMBF1 (putative translation factor)
VYQPIDHKVISDDPPVVIDRDQIRMARAGLGWSAKELARRAHLGIATIRRAETAGVTPGNMFAIQHAFEEAGVTFLDEDQSSPAGGRGVRLPRRP